MGIFSKEVCGICGKSLGFKKYKVPKSNAWVCGECLERIGQKTAFDLHEVKLEQLKAYDTGKQPEKNTVSGPLQKAEDMFAYCAMYGYSGKRHEIWALPSFRMIEESLEPGEKVETVFIGLHNFASMSKHEGNCAYALTNRRLLMAQKSPMRGKRHMGISYTEMEAMTYHPGGLIETIEVETEEGAIQIGLDKNYAGRIRQRVKKALNQFVRDRKFEIMNK